MSQSKVLLQLLNLEESTHFNNNPLFCKVILIQHSASGQWEGGFKGLFSYCTVQHIQVKLITITFVVSHIFMFLNLKFG